MEPYHKIQTVFDRDPANRYKTLLVGQWGQARVRVAGRE